MKSFKAFLKWCNNWAGLFLLLTLIWTIFASLQKNPINLKPFGSIVQWIGVVLVYPIKVPIFIIIFLIMAFIYTNRTRLKVLFKNKRFGIKPGISNFGDHSNILIGTWKNNYLTGSEICVITSDGKYYVNNVHYFNLEGLSIDASTGNIMFTKVGIRDKRILENRLKAVDSQNLEGTENGSKITYSRLN